MSETRVDRTPEVITRSGKFVGTVHQTGARLPALAWYALHRTGVGNPAATKEDALAWLERKEEQVRMGRR